MEKGQLRLLPAPQPLVERLGGDFFRSIPTEPGIYRMYDAAGILIYVGKAKNLRNRLASYRRTAGQSRKTIRLIHEVRRIEWDLCESDTSARLRENDLIRTLRPRFNRAGTWPKTARYIRIDISPLGTRLQISPEPEGECHGPFRGGPSLALGALARLLGWISTATASVTTLPRCLSASDAVRSWDLDPSQTSRWLDDLRDFLAGRSDALVGKLVNAMPPVTEGFDLAYVARQFETIEAFYRNGPLKGRRLRERFAASEEPATPETLDDWAIQNGAESTPAPPFRPEDDPAAIQAPASTPPP